MPALSYPTGAFQPFTKILSSEVNGKFTAISTLLNTTKLDYLNLQTSNLLYASQLSMQVAVTNATGQLTTTTILPVLNGGLGFAPALSASVAGQVLAVNAAGTTFQIQAVPTTPGGFVYNYYQFS